MSKAKISARRRNLCVAFTLVLVAAASIVVDRMFFRTPVRMDSREVCDGNLLPSEDSGPVNRLLPVGGIVTSEWAERPGRNGYAASCHIGVDGEHVLSITVSAFDGSESFWRGQLRHLDGLDLKVAKPFDYGAVGLSWKDTAAIYQPCRTQEEGYGSDRRVDSPYQYVRAALGPDVSVKDDRFREDLVFLASRMLFLAQAPSGCQKEGVLKPPGAIEFHD
ncbi:hypothetical protein [Streptomyces sp. TP-A0874]|uniref:hypothetical protein n=1 Tax=Streptomyces sp. TP-A0874 TaxID=549819 RepID=UPI001112FC2F|nr:hypothetical protein [Streptomyces sp. TP-A0874]